MAAERITSGVPGLDVVLQGGFLRGGLYLIEGPPGAGKTILANQICFARARGGHKSLFTTVLSETHSRMMLHLGELEFFDDKAIPKNVNYLSAFAALTSDGVKGVLDLLRREMRAHGATIVVVDGFASIEQAAPSHLDFKRFIHELQVQAGMLGCTTFLLTSTDDTRRFRAEHSMVDGLIELGEEESDRRTERQLQVSKFRGSAVFGGRHTYEITYAGVRVYPRAERLLRDAVPDGVDIGKRISTGIKELDKMLHGGLPQGTATLLVGSSGGGKTALGLSFLAQSTAREPGLLFSFYESEKRALDKAERIGLPLKKLVKSGALEVVYHSPTERLLDMLGDDLLENVKRRGVRRLVIDGLPGFMASTFTPDRMPRFFAGMFNALRAGGVTTLCTIETRSLFEQEIEIPIQGVAALAENCITLRLRELRGRLHRTILITKVRDSAFDERLRELRISASGVAVVNYSGAK